MLLQTYSGQYDVNLLIISLVFYIINIILTSSIVYYLLYRLYYKKEIKEIKTQKSIVYNLITWAIIFMIICTSNILKSISLFLIINGEPANALIITFLFRIRIVIIYIAFLVKILYLEYVLKNNYKYKGNPFSIIIGLIIIILLFIDPNELTEIGPLQMMLIALIFVGYSILPILYFYLAIKTVGESRMNSLKISAGSVFLGLGFLFRPENLGGYMQISELLKTLIGVTYILAPISMIIATILIFDSMREKKS